MIFLLKNLRKILIFFCLCIIFISVGSTIFSHWSIYSTHTFWKNFPRLKQSYVESQYVSIHPKDIIPDEIVNSYAAGAYIHGIAPELIAPDTPPLGRYLIGISAILFDNPNEITLLAGVGSLVLLF